MTCKAPSHVNKWLKKKLKVECKEPWPLVAQWRAVSPNWFLIFRSAPLVTSIWTIISCPEKEEFLCLTFDSNLLYTTWCIKLTLKLFSVCLFKTWLILAKKFQVKFLIWIQYNIFAFEKFQTQTQTKQRIS